MLTPPESPPRTTIREPWTRERTNRHSTFKAPGPAFDMWRCARRARLLRGAGLLRLVGLPLLPAHSLGGSRHALQWAPPDTVIQQTIRVLPEAGVLFAKPRAVRRARPRVRAPDAGSRRSSTASLPPILVRALVYGALRLAALGLTVMAISLFYRFCPTARCGRARSSRRRRAASCPRRPRPHLLPFPSSSSRRSRALYISVSFVLLAISSRSWSWPAPTWRPRPTGTPAFPRRTGSVPILKRRRRRGRRRVAPALFQVARKGLLEVRRVTSWRIRGGATPLNAPERCSGRGCSRRRAGS